MHEASLIAGPDAAGRRDRAAREGHAGRRASRSGSARSATCRRSISREHFATGAPRTPSPKAPGSTYHASDDPRDPDAPGCAARERRGGDLTGAPAGASTPDAVRAAAHRRAAARCRAWASGPSSTGRPGARPRRLGRSIRRRASRSKPRARPASIAALRRRHRGSHRRPTRRRAVSRSSDVAPSRRGGLRHPRRASSTGAATRASAARPRDLRGLPARTVRSGRPAPPLSVHQLHPLRPALQHHRGPALRPRAHLDAALRHVPGLPRRIRRPGRPPLPCRAQCLPRLRPAARRCGTRAGARSPATATTRSLAAAAAIRATAGSSRSRASAASTCWSTRATRRPCAACGRASAARKSRSR